jgi:hypothetical protein
VSLVSRGLVAALLGAVALSACASLGRRASLAYMAIAAELAPDKVRLQIDRSFLERYKNRVTIETRFTVDAAAKSPNPSAFDGDLHFAGRAPEIGLRLVGEIKHAAESEAAVGLIREAATRRGTLPIIGVWRLWPEHSLGGSEEQGKPVTPLDTPYPDHVFEVHPVTRVGDVSLLGNFHTLEGYKAGSAGSTLGSYQDARCTIRGTPTAVVFETPTWLYNDVHFVMEITGDEQLVAPDGRFDTAAALSTEGEQLVPSLRMVFVAGTAPERAVRGLGKGSRLHIWGLPRLDFSEISRRIQQSGATGTVLEGPLPYEIIVLGIYPDAG